MGRADCRASERRSVGPDYAGRGSDVTPRHAAYDSQVVPPWVWLCGDGGHRRGHKRRDSVSCRWETSVTLRRPPAFGSSAPEPDPGRLPRSAVRVTGRRHGWPRYRLSAAGRGSGPRSSRAGRPASPGDLAELARHAPPPTSAASCPDGRRIAVEIELSHKAPRRLRASWPATTTPCAPGGCTASSTSPIGPTSSPPRTARPTNAGLTDTESGTRTFADVQADTRREAAVQRTPEESRRG